MSPVGGQDAAAGRCPLRGEGRLTGLLPSGASGSEAEHRLFERLFEDYNEIIRPVANVSDPVIIQFEVSMSQLVKVVSVGATCRGHGYRASGRRLPRASLGSVLHTSTLIHLSRMK